MVGGSRGLTETGLIMASTSTGPVNHGPNFFDELVRCRYRVESHTFCPMS